MYGISSFFSTLKKGKANFCREPTFLGHLHTFNLHINLCLTRGKGWGTRRPSGQPCSASRRLRCRLDGLAHLDRTGGTRRNRCFVLASRKGESIKITIWAKTPCPPNGHELKPLPFPTIPLLLLTWPPFSLGRCRHFSSGPTAAHTPPLQHLYSKELFVFPMRLIALKGREPDC